MTAEQTLSHRDALKGLIQRIGHRRLLVLTMLMVLGSASEGIGLILLVPIVQVASGASTAALPFGLNVLAAVSLPAILAGFTALVSMRALITYTANEVRRDIGLNLAYEFRSQTHAAIVGADWRWLARRNSADQAALIIGESERSASLANDALVSATSALTLAALLVAAILISPQLSIALLVLALPVIGTGFLFRESQRRSGEAFWDAYARLQRHLSNGLDHLRAARIAGAQPALLKDVADASAELSQLERRHIRSGHRAQAISQVFATIALALGSILALQFWQVSLAILLPVLAIAVRSVPLLGTVYQAQRSWRFNLPAYARLRAHNRDAALHPDSAMHEGAPPEFHDRIELRDVQFGFAGRERKVFSALNFTLPAGSVTGVSAPSGWGKSTLADLLAGLLSPDRGAILIDGSPLQAANRASWRRRVGYVEQQPFFIDATIAANLAWGNGRAAESDLRRALDQASAQFVLDLPSGLSTSMGEGGRQFSGGELQRIALARALVGSPVLLILDEVTAGLDAENRAAIMDSIKALKGRCTILLLTHDPYVLAHADQVIALDSGTDVGA